MARKARVLLVDDIDGGEAGQTVSFGLDGFAYEIDLSDANAARLREALAPFVTVARKAATRRGPTAGRTGSARDRSADIRAWARAQGRPVSDRGRISQAIIDEYHAAQR
ncbi:Lsr2 family protein [Thermobifida halotolerans]|uniref:Lsr2 family protein n=1 Tax=Thermobifida halotolerans TaxID=483545 RepID=A0A399G6Y4_9ACTN|nr:Lsr2 family protein [Thermobifida halotolerans]UOE20843.1 Lsr2 family protein [Thermobifida halotolerans]